MNASPVSRCLSVSAKLSFGTAMITFLSNVSPVLAANLAITGAKNMSQNAPSVGYTKGSHGSIVFSGDDDYCGVDNVTGRGGSAPRSGSAITVEEEYRRFLEQAKFNGTSPYSQSSTSQIWSGDGKTNGGTGYMGKDSTGGDTNIMPEAYGIYSFATGCGSSAQGNYSVAFGANATAVTGGSQAFGVAALASGKVTVAIGVGAEASGDAAVAFGGLTKASGERSIAIGTKSSAQGKESIAIGSGTEGGEKNNSASAMGIQAIAIGSNAMGLQDYSVVVGASAVVSVSKGIALGYGSVANVGDGILGYDPTGDTPSKDKSAAWKSSVGSLSIGNPEENITRQITGVAAGTADTDAVNVAQLKALRGMITKQEGWDLIVDGAEKTTIGSGDTLVLAAGSKNFEITKDKDDKKVKFDLAKDITLDSVKTGENTFDRMGLIIKDGPKITTSGISAGNKKITGIKEGTENTDAVNFAQLEEVKKQLEGSILVVQDTKTQHITIGKDTGGDKIDIANKDKGNRTLTGVKNGALSKDSNEAVTGSQLFATNNDVVILKNNFSEIQTSVTSVQTNLSTISTNTSQYLGGGADVLNSKAPTYTIEDESYNDVSSAFSGVSGSFTKVKQQITDVSNSVTNVENQIKNVVNNSLVKQNIETQNITIGKGAGGDKIDITNNKNEQRTLTGIKNGDISKDSKEAVTGSQLFETNKNIATYLGGGADYKDGKWSAPTFTLKTVNDEGKEEDKTYQNVSDALTGVGTSFTNVQNKIIKDITNQINNAITNIQGDSLVKKDSKTNDIIIGREVEGSAINIANKNGEDRTISGVKAATQENEAINKGQFDTSIKYVNNEITNKYNELNQNITNITQQVKGDSLLWSSEKGAFVAQHGEEKTNSKISFLANGDITKNSMDAINGSQLYSMGNSLAAYLGGGAEYKDGKWAELTLKVNTVKDDGTANEESYHTVADAFSAVGTSFTNIQNTITNEITKEINKTKGDALLWDNEKEAFVAQHGEGDKKAESKIMHLKAGDITAQSMDAINGSQLYSVINSLSGYFGGGASYQNGEWKEPTFYVSQFKNDGSSNDKSGYHDVAGAFEGVNDSMKNINERINNVAKDISSSGLNWNETEKAFDARHDGVDSKITHVADGDVSKGSKDVVNGGQLWETNKKVEAVEDRVESIDQHVKDIENTVTNDAVKYDKGADGKKSNKITLVGGNESEPVLIDNVADGRIESGSKEAVNGSQLWETNQQMKTILDDAKKYTDERFNDIINSQMEDVINEAKSYTNMKFESLRYEVREVRKESRQAAAIGLAVSNLSYEDTPGSLSLSIGTGVWRSQSAFAIGAGYMSENGKIRSNISVTSSGSHWGIGAGLRVKLN
ncbi:hypothetical protein GCM10023262_03570 [Bartonella pachyuromydis]|uniref:Surface protein/Bartonella adhesin n=1 Tax=Bartonella pachyuromydis TaxID=931097 RepID=A0ABP8VDH9_9HYPH